MSGNKSNSATKRRGIAAQLDMLSALNKPSQDRERFIDRAILEIKNLQYLQTRILVSEDLTKEQKEYISAKMSDTNLSFCHGVYYLGMDTSKYRHWQCSRYEAMIKLPDNLSYFDPEDRTTLHEMLTNSRNRITGLLVANKDIIESSEREFLKVIRLLNIVIYYVRGN